MRVVRAHSYRAVETVRHELTRIPLHWMEMIEHISWVILPDGLRPTYIGLLERDYLTHDGQHYDTVGGWYCMEGALDNQRYPPHIYLNHSSAWGTVHEVAHALADVWHPPLQEFFKPNSAFYSYMAINPDEYFACAVDAFLNPAQNDEKWNRNDLAARNQPLLEFLELKEMAA